MKTYIKWVLILVVAFVVLRFGAPWLISQRSDIAVFLGVLLLVALPIILIGIYKLLGVKHEKVDSNSTTGV